MQGLGFDADLCEDGLELQDFVKESGRATYSQMTIVRIHQAGHDEFNLGWEHFLKGGSTSFAIGGGIHLSIRHDGW